MLYQKSVMILRLIQQWSIAVAKEDYPVFNNNNSILNLMQGSTKIYRTTILKKLQSILV